MIPRAVRTWFDKRKALFWTLWLLPLPASAGPSRDAVLLLGGSSAAADSSETEVRPDFSDLPTGAEFEPGVRPPGSAKPACSARHPLCVHPRAGVPDRAALAALDALERAYDRLILTLGLP